LHLYYIMVFVSVNVLLMVLLMTFISGWFMKTDLIQATIIALYRHIY
jgi:hypothetical protein